LEPHNRKELYCQKLAPILLYLHTMQLSVLEPFRQPPGPIGGHVFYDLALELALNQMRDWKLTGRTVFKIKDSPDRWITFETDGSSQFEASFQSAAVTWQKIIGVKFNIQGCCELAKGFFDGNESLLNRYPLDSRRASKRLTKEQLAKVQAFQEQIATRPWWQFWK
jgi:hypothetical protein